MSFTIVKKIRNKGYIDILSKIKAAQPWYIKIYNIKYKDTDHIELTLERADGYLSQIPMFRHDMELLKSILKQLILAVYHLNVILGINHNDLHKENLMYKREETPVTHEGYIGDKHIVIKNIRYTLKIIDYDHATVISSDHTCDIHKALFTISNILWFKEIDHLLHNTNYSCSKGTMRIKEQNPDIYLSLYNSINEL